MKFAFAPALALVIGLPGIGAAHDYVLGDLQVIHPKAFETPVAAKSGAGYLTIANNGDSDDKLVGIRADFDKVTLHKSEETNGVATMSPVEALPIPAGETVELAPGGYHVMFMGLGGDRLEADNVIPAVLVFEKAGELEIEFKVEPRATGEADAAGEDHSGHE